MPLDGEAEKVEGEAQNLIGTVKAALKPQIGAAPSAGSGPRFVDDHQEGGELPGAIDGAPPPAASLNA